MKENKTRWQIGRFKRLIEILNFLEKQKSNKISVLDLSEKFSISIRQVKKDISDLRKLGAEIVSLRYGYKRAYILKNYKRIIKKLNKTLIQ